MYNIFLYWKIDDEAFSKCIDYFMEVRAKAKHYISFEDTNNNTKTYM